MSYFCMWTVTETVLLIYIICCSLVALFFIIDAYINPSDFKYLPDCKKKTMGLAMLFSPVMVTIGIVVLLVVLPFWGIKLLFFKSIEKANNAGKNHNKKHKFNEKRHKLAKKYKNNPIKLVEEFEKLIKE